MNPLKKAWSQLETEGETGDGFVRLRIRSQIPCAVYAAREIASGLGAIVFEVDTKAIPPDIRYPTSVGFEVRAEPLTPGRHGRSRIRLSLTAERFKDVFLTLGEDIVESLGSATTPESAIKALVGRLSRWQNFLRQYGPEGLPLERRRGLFGELAFLRNWLLPKLSPVAAIEAWAGPAKANQDFQLKDGAVEVKTTAASTPQAVNVANVSQLDPKGLRTLFLLLVSVEESNGSETSLPELVDLVRRLLDEQARPQFEELLMEAGYFESQKDLYRTPRYRVRNDRFFEVRNGFPRVVLEELREGVVNVSYAITISTCAEFECDGNEVVARITGSRGKR